MDVLFIGFICLFVFFCFTMIDAKTVFFFVSIRCGYELFFLSIVLVKAWRYICSVIDLNKKFCLISGYICNRFHHRWLKWCFGFCIFLLDLIYSLQKVESLCLCVSWYLGILLFSFWQLVSFSSFTPFGLPCLSTPLRP